jgi:hypothetical protein
VTIGCLPPCDDAPAGAPSTSGRFARLARGQTLRVGVGDSTPRILLVKRRALTAFPWLIHWSPACVTDRDSLGAVLTDLGATAPRAIRRS